MVVGVGGQELLEVELDAVLLRPGSMPISWVESERTSWTVMISCSPLGLVTVQTPSVSSSRFGEFIQLRGL